MVSYENKAGLLESWNDYAIINMTLISENTIDGIVSLPSETASTGGIPVLIQVSSIDVDHQDSTYVEIP